MALYWQANGDTTKAWNGSLTPTNFTEIRDLLKDLDVSDIAGQSGTILSKGNWRLDRQNPTPDASNIQIQRNGVPNPSTVAGVLVPDILTVALTSAPKGLDKDARDRIFGSRMKELYRAVRGALGTSAATLTDELSDKGRPNGKKCIKMQRIGGQFTI